MRLTKIPKPKSADHCPRFKECAHHKNSVIGMSGRCPDCGTQVFRPAPMFLSASGRHKMPGYAGRLRAIRMYEGRVID